VHFHVNVIYILRKEFILWPPLNLYELWALVWKSSTRKCAFLSFNTFWTNGIFFEFKMIFLLKWIRNYKMCCLRDMKKLFGRWLHVHSSILKWSNKLPFQAKLSNPFPLPTYMDKYTLINRSYWTCNQCLDFHI
jgi:hypothetical protein